MALQHVLIPNSYAVIDSVNYSKQQKHASFNLKIYADSQKQVLITSLQFSVDGNNIVEEIESFEITTPPDIEEAVGKKWIVPNGGTGFWSGHIGRTVFLREVTEGFENPWTYCENEGNTIYVKDKAAYYRCGNPMTEVSFISSREFDEYFNFDKVEEDGILGCCYQFITSFYNFPNVENV